MFLRNVWYVAGFSSELLRGNHIGRKLLGEPVVIFRTASGAVGAIEDRCCHRAMPLSWGQVTEESIRCRYHGFEFDATGACTRIPGCQKIPANARVRSYPVVEKDLVVWIWMGNPADADLALIPNHPVHTDRRWAWRTMYYHLDASWNLLVDNLMDLTHLAYVHSKTIGGSPDIHFGAETKLVREGNRVRVLRHMPNSTPPITYVTAAGFAGLVDRWQEVEFEPMIVRVSAGACDAGKGALEGRRDDGFSMVMLHGITPESQNTTHYLWSIATNVIDRGIPESVFAQIEVTIGEDKDVLEAQQRCIDGSPGGKFVDSPGDVGANQTRRLIRSLLDAEHQPAAGG